jgi:ethanolamine utilization protein EutQ (cupin superfamily)
MSTSPVRNLPFDSSLSENHGPLLVDQRTRASGLVDLGAGFVDFPDGGTSAQWTTPYEEVIYVLTGELTVAADAQSVRGRPGDVLTIAKGTTVTYGGTRGTRVFFSLVPADWYLNLPSADE